MSGARRQGSLNSRRSGIGSQPLRPMRSPLGSNRDVRPATSRMGSPPPTTIDRILEASACASPPARTPPLRTPPPELAHSAGGTGGRLGTTKGYSGASTPLTGYASTPGAKALLQYGSAAGCGSRVSRVKLCVCGASSNLGRERSRLLKAEQALMQRLRRVNDREDDLNACDDSICNQEEELRQRRVHTGRQSQELIAQLDCFCSQQETGRQEQDVLSERETNAEQRKRELARLEQRVQRRLDRVEASRLQLEEDTCDVYALKDEMEGECHALEDSRRAAADSESLLLECRGKGTQVSCEIEQQRAGIRARQLELEPVQHDLQAKEADMNERESLNERRKQALLDREQDVDRMKREAKQAFERSAALHSGAEETEQRMSSLWDDIHQRQQVLEAIDTSLRGREERLDAAQRNMAYAREAPPGDGSQAVPGAAVHSSVRNEYSGAQWSSDVEPEAEQARLELIAAELTERAWRERSTALAEREADLEYRIELLEADLGVSS